MANCFEKDFVILEFLPYFSERFSWANKNEFWLLFQCIFNGNTMVLHWNYFSFMEKSLMFSLEKIFQKNMIKILESQNPFRSSLPSSSSNSWCNIKAKFFCKVYYRCPKHLTIYHINLSQIHWFWVEPYWDPSYERICLYFENEKIYQSFVTIYGKEFLVNDIQNRATVFSMGQNTS